MRKLFSFLIVLFLSFQQVILATTEETTSVPDSVYLFSFATSGDDGRSVRIRNIGLKSPGIMDIFVAITVVGGRRRKCSIPV